MQTVAASGGQSAPHPPCRAPSPRDRGEKERQAYAADAAVMEREPHILEMRSVVPLPRFNRLRKVQTAAASGGQSAPHLPCRAPSPRDRGEKERQAYAADAAVMEREPHILEMRSVVPLPRGRVGKERQAYTADGAVMKREPHTLEMPLAVPSPRDYGEKVARQRRMRGARGTSERQRHRQAVPTGIRTQRKDQPGMRMEGSA